MTDPYLSYLEASRTGHDQGLTPFMGEWRQAFDFLPYSAGANSRQAFVGAVRGGLTNRFLFAGLIQVTITLQLETQKVMESDAYGDLDNYAKSVNDALKGRAGLFIDDCQIHRLDIAFELSSRATFDIEIKATHPEEFVLKQGLKLYGMPDGLFYPQAEALWSEGQVDQLDTFNTVAGLLIWETMTRNKKALRHDLRTAGATRLKAFQHARPTMPLQWAFHRSRAIASGIEMVEHANWRAACAAFRASDHTGRLAAVEREMAEYAQTIGEVAKGLIST
jgi:Holliday junction resolvase RusA-like endonuclease